MSAAECENVQLQHKQDSVLYHLVFWLGVLLNLPKFSDNSWNW